MNPALLVLALSMTIASGAAPDAELSVPATSPGDPADVWIISTRRLPGGACADGAQPDYWRLAVGEQWAAADEAAFLAADRARIPTVFFIHGNRWDADRATAEGMAFCEQLKCLAPGVRFRLVIWSWPADRISRRNRPDVIAKDVRSQDEAVYLARLLDRVDPDVPISLVGYSYGAQSIVGALRLLAGECYAGFVLERRGPARRAPLAAVLVAGAMESCALASADPTRSPLSQVDRLLVTCNSRDSNLKFFPLLYGRRGPQAIGVVGPSCLDPGDPHWQKVEVVDVTSAVGRRHDWECYRDAWPLASRLARYTFLEPIQKTSEVSETSEVCAGPPGAGPNGADGE